MAGKARMVRFRYEVVPTKGMAGLADAHFRERKSPVCVGRVAVDRLALTEG
jgi:hypothetical protein